MSDSPTPDPHNTDAALTARLLAARADGDYAPDWLNGTIDLDQALALQLAVLDQHLEAGQSVGGWKVGLTSEASRRKLGADERPFGFVLGSRTFDSGADIPFAEIVGPSIETEMCFTVKTEITDATIGPDRIFEHFETVAAGFELNEKRPGSVPPDFCAMVTDCLTNWGIAGGPGPAPVSAADLMATTITMERNGEQVFTGVSSDHCDDHAISLTRLVEQLARHGQTLQPGQRVITGAFARFPVAIGDHWRAVYSGPAFPDPSIVELTFR